MLSSLLLSTLPTTLLAQNPALVPARAAVTDSTAVRLAAEKADTGRWMPGYTDLSRYDTPGYCKVLIQSVNSRTWRRGEQDTIERGSAGDTIAGVAMALGRKCARALRIADVAPAELYNFMELLIALGDTVRLDSLLRRQLALAPNDEERAWILSDAIAISLTAKPARRSFANALVARLDSLGPKAVEPWVAAMKAQAEFAKRSYDTATLFTAQNPFAQRIGSVLQHGTDQDKFAVAGGLATDSAEHSYYLRQPELSAGYIAPVFHTYTSIISRQAAETYLEGIRFYATHSRAEIRPLTDGIWLPDSTEFPKRGKVTLVYRLLRRVEESSVPFTEGRLNERLSWLRRLKSTYGDKVDIVLVVSTVGHIWSSPPLSAADEAKAIRWLFVDHLKLPFTVFVDKIPFFKRDDGKLIPGESKNYITAGHVQETDVIGPAIIDKNQRLYLVMDTPSESRIRAYVARALQEEMTPPSAAQRTAK